MTARPCGGDCCRQKMPAAATVADHIEQRWPTPLLSHRAQRLVLGALKLGEEAGEVAGAVVRWTEDRGTKRAITDEMADVQIVLLRLADLLHIDLAEITAERWAEVRER